MLQEKYVEEVFKKFKMTSWNVISTPIESSTKLYKYAYGDRVDARKYRSLIRSFKYLTNTR